ncbi:hypothetical protein [Photobacterium sanguinicancri]|uniref:hypothetical protein n=1 Tax=Photobacterium sanguinicancri TaxID=875932 RepID=UPI000AAC7D4E|nr:hypothetical protein [Photobacterium sanguinicancri]
MESLLVIEDDLGIQKQLKWCFTDYEVVTAGDRKSAITALRRHEPKVITLDLAYRLMKLMHQKAWQPYKKYFLFALRLRLSLLQGMMIKQMH